VFSKERLDLAAIDPELFLDCDKLPGQSNRPSCLDLDRYGIACPGVAPSVLDPLVPDWLGVSNAVSPQESSQVALAGPGQLFGRGVEQQELECAHRFPVAKPLEKHREIALKASLEFQDACGLFIDEGDLIFAVTAEESERICVESDWFKPVFVDSETVGEGEGVEGIGLAGGHRVAITPGLRDLRIDVVDGNTLLDQMLDDEPLSGLDRDSGNFEIAESEQELVESRLVVGDFEAQELLAVPVDRDDGESRMRPIETDPSRLWGCGHETSL